MLVDLSSFDLGDPLLEAAVEIDAIEDYHAVLEGQIEQLQQTQRQRLDGYLKKEKLTPNDPEWHEAIQEYYHWVDSILPRFFRGPFLVSLYALYESVVLEVATAIQKLNPQLQQFKSFKKKERLNFLEKAYHYYKEMFGRELCSDSLTWERLTVLSKLRHAVAHANGRVESLQPPKFRAEVIQIANDTPDLDASSGYITFGKEFVAHTSRLVISELRRFIEEHREACRPRGAV